MVCLLLLSILFFIFVVVLLLCVYRTDAQSTVQMDSVFFFFSSFFVVVVRVSSLSVDGRAVYFDFLFFFLTVLCGPLVDFSCIYTCMCMCVCVFSPFFFFLRDSCVL